MEQSTEIVDEDFYFQVFSASYLAMIIFKNVKWNHWQ